MVKNPNGNKLTTERDPNFNQIMSLRFVPDDQSFHQLTRIRRFPETRDINRPMATIPFFIPLGIYSQNRILQDLYLLFYA